MSVDVRGLKITIGGKPIVSDADMTIADGERVGLIGSSGSGKSMIAKAMLGLLPLTAVTNGSIDMGGTEIIGASERALADLRGRYVGAVFQNPAHALNPVMTVAQQIALPLRLHYDLTKAERADRVNALLSKVGLDLDMAGKYPHELSGGQQQRVGIARALANDPRVLLSDEATSALDPETTIATLELLKRINKELGLTIVMITHQMDVVKQICDRVAVMNKGIVVEEGSVIDVFRRPQTETTKALIGNIMAQELPGSMLERVREQVAGLDKDSVHILRLSFVGSEVTRPVISEASRMFNIDVNILLGQVDEVQGKGFGTLTILTSCNTDTFSQLLEYLRKHNVTVEEVTSHVL